VSIRTATDHDVPQLRRLISESARRLSVGYYSTEQIEACVREIFGVDTQLIIDGSYYVVEVDGEIVAAGGWSARKALYGGDQMKTGPDALLDPQIDAARIRAFFVHPDWSRRGLARLIFNHCSDAAWAAGFRNFELMATQPGEPFYSALGFIPGERVIVRLSGDVDVPFVRMTRTIQPATDRPVVAG
jgi:N-acetylglutamate synthase-like GNAT family acetyltransferase